VTPPPRWESFNACRPGRGHPSSTSRCDHHNLDSPYSLAPHSSVPSSYTCHMGQSPSTPLPSSLPSYALHVLRIADHSPSAGVFEPFFDYLIGVTAASGSQVPGPEGGMDLSPVQLGRIVMGNEGKEVGLRVYNAKSQRIRGESRVWVGFGALGRYPGAGGSSVKS